MRIVFFGTPREAAGVLKTLFGSRHDVVAVFTQPDRPKGRGLKVEPSAVKRLAAQRGLKVLEPEKLSDEKIKEALVELNADIGVVVAYGKIIPSELLSIPKSGMINIHASLLPKYRGAAPIQWALLNGEKETGVTIFKLAEMLDAGDVIAQESVKIEGGDNAGSLGRKLFDAGGGLLLKILDDLDSGKAKFTKQDETKVTYAPKITKAIGSIDWRDPAEKIFNKIRALAPQPGAFTYHRKKILKILAAEYGPLAEKRSAPGTIVEVAKNSGFVVSTSHGDLFVKVVQPESGKKMNAWEFVIGHQVKCGDILPS